MNVRADPKANKAEQVRLVPEMEDREFLPAALEIIETPVSPSTVYLMLFICFFAIFGLTWSWFGKLDIYATIRGKIEPAGHSKVLQPLETGKVSSLPARDGQSVSAGQVIMTLDGGDVEAQIALDSQAIAAAKSESLRRQAVLAAVEGGQMDRPPAIDWPLDIPASMKQRQEAVLAGDLRELSAALENLAAQKSERLASVAQLEASITAQKFLQETLDERVELKQKLVDKSVGTRTGLLDAVQTVRQAQTQLAGDVGKRVQAIEAAASIDAERSKLLAAFVADNIRKLADALRLVDEKTAERNKAEVRLNRLTLRAPVDGVVHSLTVTTIGQVVTAGQELLRIAPLNAPIEIQAYTSNEDVGFISPGQIAFVKVDAFPFTRYGTIEATVMEVASDSIPSDVANKTLGDATQKASDIARGQALAKPLTDLVFETRLSLKESSIRINNREVNLSPGMTVTVEVKTGTRRVLEYLFSPLLEIGNKAMKER